MAQLNTFKSLQHEVITTKESFYTCPVGYTTIVLNAQCANIHTGDVEVSLSLDKSGTEMALVKDLPIPPGDAANLATGKLVLQSGDQLKVQSNTGTSGAHKLELTLSFLETLDA